MPRGIKSLIALTLEQRQQLINVSRQRNNPHSQVQRARLILEVATGASHTSVARKFGVTAQTVVKWCRRFITVGLAGLADAPRPGGPRLISDDRVEQIIDITLQQQPPVGVHWTTRLLARHLGMSQSAISRIWRAHEIDPRRQDHWRPSRDPALTASIHAIAGLFFAPGFGLLALHIAPPPLDVKSGQSKFLRRLDNAAKASKSPAEQGIATVLISVWRKLERQPQHGFARPLLSFLKNLESRACPGSGLLLLTYPDGTERLPSISLWLVRHPRVRLRSLDNSAAWIGELKHWLAIAERQDSNGGQKGSLVRLLNHAVATSHIPSQPISWISLSPRQDGKRRTRET